MDVAGGGLAGRRASARRSEGETVLDACAGRGNKTGLLARAVGPGGAVDAADLHPAKLERLASELERIGLAPRATFAVDWAAAPAAQRAVRSDPRRRSVLGHRDHSPPARAAPSSHGQGSASPRGAAARSSRASPGSSGPVVASSTRSAVCFAKRRRTSSRPPAAWGSSRLRSTRRSLRESPQRAQRRSGFCLMSTARTAISWPPSSEPARGSTWARRASPRRGFPGSRGLDCVAKGPMPTVACEPKC